MKARLVRARIRRAIDRGINFMDNCWDYHDGGSEIRMGKAQVAALLSRTSQAAATGKYEGFKTTPAFDATARHPEWIR